MNFSKNCINAQSKLNLSINYNFFKNTSRLSSFGELEIIIPFTDTENTLGVIYIVRD